MDRQLIFQKALLQLDQGRYDDGERNLRKVIQLSEEENDPLLEARALCSLGDLLQTRGRYDEALVYLQKTLSFERNDDLLDYELQRVKDLIHAIQSRG